MLKNHRLLRALLPVVLCFSGCSSPGPETRLPDGVLSVTPAPVTLALGLMRCVQASILQSNGDEVALEPGNLNIVVSDPTLLQVAEASACSSIVQNGIGLIGVGAGTGTATFSIADVEDIPQVRLPVEVLDAAIELNPSVVPGFLVDQERIVDAPAFSLYNAERVEISSGKLSLVPSRIKWESGDPGVLSIHRDGLGHWVARGVSRGTTTLTVTYDDAKGAISAQTNSISVVDGELVGIEGAWALFNSGARDDLALPSGPDAPRGFPPKSFEEGSCFTLGLTATYRDRELMTAVSVDYSGGDIAWSLDGTVSVDGSGRYCAECCGEALVTGCVGDLCATGGFSVFPAGHWASLELALLREGPVPMTELQGYGPVFCAPLVATATTDDGVGVDVAGSPFVYWEGLYVDSEYPLYFVVMDGGMPCFSWDGSRHRDPVSVTISGCYLDFDLCDSIGLSFVDAR